MNGNFVLLGIMFLAIASFQFAMRKRWAREQSERMTSLLFRGAPEMNVRRMEMLTIAFASFFALAGLVVLLAGVFSSP